MGLVYGIENEYVLYQKLWRFTQLLYLVKNSHTIKVIEKNISNF